MPSPRDNRRRCYLVDRKFQIKYIALLCLVSLAVGIMADALFYFLGTHEVAEAYYTAHRQIAHTKEILAPGLLAASSAALLALIVVAARAVFITHRLAGAAFHLRRDIALIADGDLTVVTRLRVKDELQDLAAAVTEMTKQLRCRVVQAREALDRVGEQLTAAQSAVDAGEADRAREALATAAEGLAAVGEPLSQLKVGAPAEQSDPAQCAK